MIRLRVSPTQTDYLDFIRFRRRHTANGRRLTRLLRTLIALTTPIVFCAAVLRGGSLPTGKQIAATAVLCAAGCALLQVLLAPLTSAADRARLARAVKKGTPPCAASALLEFGEEAFTVTMPTGGEEQFYPAIRRICVIRGRAVYLLLDVAEYILPAAAFSPPSRQEELLTFLQDRCGKRIEYFGGRDGAEAG